MEEITIGGTVYIVWGDYPDGLYKKVPKDLYESRIRPNRVSLEMIMKKLIQLDNKIDNLGGV